MLLFLHGQDSSSQGSKAQYFLKNFLPGIVIPDFVGSFEERMVTLRELLTDEDDLTIIGSSLGGLMAAWYAVEQPEKIKRLILLAPAIGFEETRAFFEAAEPVTQFTTIFHGLQDTVVPLEPVRKMATALFRNLDFRVVDDDHRLMATTMAQDWKELVGEEER